MKRRVHETRESVAKKPGVGLMEIDEMEVVQRCGIHFHFAFTSANHTERAGDVSGELEEASRA